MNLVRPATLAALLLLTATPPGALAGAPAWTRYVNARYGYAIDYPAGKFRMDPPLDNGDGRGFRSIRGGARFLVWASHVGREESPRRFVERQSQACREGRARYALKSKAMAVVSCERRGEVFYVKQLFGKRIATGFQMTYPASERGRWDMALARMAESLKAATRD